MTNTIKMINTLNRNFNWVKPWEVVNIWVELRAVYELNWFKLVETVKKEEQEIKQKEIKEKKEKQDKEAIEKNKKEEELKKQALLEKEAKEKKEKAEK